MLSIKYIRENTEEVKKKLARKLVKPVLIDEAISLDKKQRELQQILDGYKAERNKISEEIASIKDNDERNRKINQMQSLKQEIKKIEPELEDISQRLISTINLFPNLPDDIVPQGSDETGNIVLREVGEKTAFSFPCKDYITLSEELDIIDVKRAAKVSGSRFGYLKRGGALLDLALMRLAFDILTEGGFIPVIPPVMIKQENFEGMGRLAGDQKEERYYLPKDDLYLVGSAEHTIGPMHKDEIFRESDLPLRYIAFSTCFRREAGSYGKDTKGIWRVHQFNKAEMFSIIKPENSEKEHLFLLSMQEKLMQALGLPYQVVEICTGDMGWTDARQYDIEVWLPSQERYRETHSCSNTTDFQARGVNIKYRRSDDQKIEFVHMLNATAFSQRPILAIIENYQQKDGSVRVPEVLQKYMGGMTEIRN